MGVELYGSRGVLRVGRVSVGEDVVDDLVLEGGEFDFDETGDVVWECCGCNEWLVRSDERLGT